MNNTGSYLTPRYSHPELRAGDKSFKGYCTLRGIKNCITINGI